MKQTFGHLLRELRRAKGISQRELAKQVSVDFSYISKLENDRLPPPAADTIVKICEVLNVQPDKLLSITKKMPSHIKDLVSSTPKALEFLRNAHSLKLTEDEWDKMSKQLKHLRDS
jgi:transcriptional regulator with XRE-family HTH domain